MNYHDKTLSRDRLEKLFKCSNGVYISKSQICDAITDCAITFDDEFNCTCILAGTDIKILHSVTETVFQAIALVQFFTSRVTLAGAIHQIFSIYHINRLH